MNPKSSLKIIRLPSTDDSGHFDRHVLIPDGVDIVAALSDINDVICSVNEEDELHDGECLDGKSVEENIQRRVAELGYVFLDRVGTSLNWDETYSNYGSDLTHEFSMRAECDVDVLRFRKALRSVCTESVLKAIPHSVGYPDQVVELHTNLTNEAVIDLLKNIPDAHRMIQTLVVKEAATPHPRVEDSHRG